MLCELDLSRLASVGDCLSICHQINKRLAMYLSKRTNLFRYTYQKTIPQPVYDDLTKHYGGDASATSWFPLKFRQKSNVKSSLLAYLTSNRPIMAAFDYFVRFLADPLQGSSEFVETTLRDKWQAEYTLRNCRVKLLRSKVLRSRILDDVRIFSVFIHRELNMPSDCYSFHARPGSEITYTLKKHFGRSTDLQLQQELKEKYEKEEWERIYVEKYDYHVSKEHIVRELHEI